MCSGLVFPAEFQCHCSSMEVLVAADLDIRTGITNPCWISRFWSVFLSAFFCGNVTSMFKTPLVLLYIITNCAYTSVFAHGNSWSFLLILELQHSPGFVLWFVPISCLLDFTKMMTQFRTCPQGHNINGVMNTPVKCGLEVWTCVCCTAAGSRSCWCVTEEK